MLPSFLIHSVILVYICMYGCILLTYFLLVKFGLTDSFNLLVNNGAAAGQVVFHTHIHIIPRKASDCLWASESLRRRKLKLDHEALQLAYSIREKLPFFDNLEDSKGQGSSLTHS
nr:adenylylsulfatase HINT3 [Ipomoea batatas]